MAFCCSLTELEQKIELSLRQSDVNSKSKKKARQMRKRSHVSKEGSDSDLAKKKHKTEMLIIEEESEEVEEMVYSSSESVESSEEEDNEIIIQP